MREQLPELVLQTESAADTHELGKRLAERLELGTVVVLSGTLGAGKTTLVQGIAAGLGVSDTVTSPTFVLAVPYIGRKAKLVHVDAYRIRDLNETDDLAFDELVSEGAILLVEWGERIERALPAIDLTIELEHVSGDSRKIVLRARSAKIVTAIAAISV